MYETSWGMGWVRFEGPSPIESGLPGRPPPVPEAATRPGEIAHLVDRLEQYFRGGPLPRVDAAMLRRAGTTAFLHRVYEVVSQIPRGETAAYGEVAAAAGRPAAARSVGAAMARNPLAPLIPCHRVVGSDGRLRGYGGGLALKRHLLEMELGHA